MKRLLPFFVLMILAACSSPNPATPSITPAASPSLIPTASPSLIPATVPTPFPAIQPPTSEPTRGPNQASAAVRLPALEQTIDLGPIEFGNSLSVHPAVVDDQADRIYLSVSPSRTLVLDANSLASIGEIPFGGALSLDAGGQRLYIGVPGTYAYAPDGTSVITPAELKLIDTSNLAVLHSAIFSATSTTSPLVAVDAANHQAYVTQDSLTLVDAATLEVQGTFSVSNSTALETVILPQPQRLFVSLNNNIPGLNNNNSLAIFDLRTGQMMTQNFAGSVDGLAVDETTDTVFAALSTAAASAIVKYDAEGQVLKRLDGVSGALLIDPLHDRVYLFQWREHSSLKVFDRDLNFIGAVRLPQITMPQVLLLDPERDRVLVLQNGGQLFVFTGQGQPLESIETEVVPDRHAVQLIAPAPSSGTKPSWLALFAPDEYVTAQGTAFRSDNEGLNWQLLSGLPAAAVTDLKFADQLLFAAAGGNGTTDGYGIWRSANAGQTWQPASHGLSDLGVTDLAISPDFARDGTLFALSKRGVFRSTDRGATWTALADRYAPLLKDLTVNFMALAVSPEFAQNQTVLIGHTSGLWRSTDRGETWSKIEGGPHATRLAYAPHGSTVLAIDYDGVQRSDDGGLTWRQVNDGLDPINSTIGDVQINDREAVILVTRFDQPGALYRLPLTETTWQPIPLDVHVSAVALTPEGTVLIGTADGLVRRLN